MSTFKTSIIEKSSFATAIKEWILVYIFTPASLGIKDIKEAEVRIVSAKFKLTTGGSLSMEMMPYLFFNQRKHFIEHCYKVHMEMLKNEEDRVEASISKLHDDAKRTWEKQQSTLTPAEVKANYENDPAEFPTLARQMHEGNEMELSTTIMEKYL